MKSLTLWQPWATLIIHGPKRIENRTWAPPHFVMNQRIAIHAGKKFQKDVWDDLKMFVRPDGPRTPPLGAIVGTAIVRGYVLNADKLPEEQKEWFNGPVGWVLDEIIALPEPISCNGAQGLWDVPPDIEQQILRKAG